MDKQFASRKYTGVDNRIYYLGVLDIIDLLNTNWKELTWRKSTYTQVKEKIQNSCSEDFYHQLDSKEKYIFNELQYIKRKGIIVLIGANELRHTTL